MALTEEQIAVRILALDEGESVDEWVAKWEPLFHGWSQEDHSGDCTKQPWTCSRCLYETTMARVPDFKRILNLCPPMTQNNMEVVAYAEVIDGKVVSVRLDKSRHCTEPLVTLTSAQAEIATLKQAVDAFADICDELGCERDNEAGLQAAHALKQERDALMAIVVDCLDSANVLLETQDPAALEYIIQKLRDGSALQPLEPKND